MGLDAPSHWVIIAIVVIVLFGYKKLPEMSRSLGRSLRIFKTEMKGLTDDETARAEAETAAPTPPPAATVPVTPVPVTPVPATSVPATSVPVAVPNATPVTQATEAPVLATQPAEPAVAEARPTQQMGA
jgi:sec-independent protein translocase protein TatA